jgi:outer membrane lipoprotein-sorting protein
LKYLKEDENYHYIEMRPRTVDDKKQLIGVRLVLSKESFLPCEVRIVDTCKVESVYDIRKLKVNVPLERKDFAEPKLPPGWKRDRPAPQVHHDED